MALFINRHTTPIHVFLAERGEAVSTTEGPAHYELSGRANVPSLCGISVDEANSQASVRRDYPAGLLVSEVRRWETLRDFVQVETLCDECRAALPEAWPPAAEALTDEMVADGIDLTGGSD